MSDVQMQFQAVGINTLSDNSSLKLQCRYAVLTWFNAVAFITLIIRGNYLTRQLFKFDHYSLLTNDVYVQIFTINCGLIHVWQLFKV